jgi:dihydropteroate synthase
MNRRTFYWKLRNSELALGERTLIMGVLNVTPDSFSDGGLFRDPDRAYARALELEEQGADIIDIGGESTRPGSTRISADEEWQRLVPALKRLRGNLRVPLSIDTYKSEIAARALDYGVEIINDPSGLTFDAALAKTAASANAGLILNHMRGTPESWAKLAPLPDAPAAVTRDLEAMVNRARRAGVEQNRIVIDPGLGFGKRGDQNAEILAHLGELARLELPILVGPSRKSFLRQKSNDETIFATAAAVAAAILKGAHIVRVHDVKEMRAAALVTDEIVRAGAVLRVLPERPVQRPKVSRPTLRDLAGREEQRPPRPPLPQSPEAERPREVDRTKPPHESARDFQRGQIGPRRDREFRGRDTERTQRGPRQGPGDRDRSGPPRRSGGDREFRGRDTERTQRGPRQGPGDRDRSGPPRRSEGETGSRRDREFRGRDTERTQRGPHQGRGDRGRSGPPRSRPEGESGPPRGDQRRGGKPPKRVFRKRP